MYLYEKHQIPLHKMSVISYGEDKPVAPNAVIASRLTIGHLWPGAGEPGRSANRIE